MDALQPARGTSETMIVRLRELLSPHAPQMLTRWRGCPEALVERYAALAFGAEVRAIPRSYLTYVRSLGADDGGLFASFGITTSLEAVVDLYDDCIRSEPGSLSAHLPVIATYCMGDRSRRPMPSPPSRTSDSDMA